VTEGERAAADEQREVPDGQQELAAEEQTVTIPAVPAGDDQPERLPADDGFPAADPRPGEYATGLVSLAFIKAALWRSAWLWCATAIAGMLIGLGLNVALPPAHQASTTVLLVHSPSEVPNDAVLTDIALAQSHTVAERAVRQLGLRQSAGSFLAAYTVTQVTDRVLVITASAPSSGEAVRHARAVAGAFLQFRAQEARTQQQFAFHAYDVSVADAKQAVASLNTQISKVEVQPVSASQQAELGNLKSRLEQAVSDLDTRVRGAKDAKQAMQVATDQMVGGSKVVDAAAPGSYSHLKLLATYAASGLLVGLALGVGIVIVRALVSDRLRRRDDVAHALGAPVKLSVGTVRTSRWLPGRHGLAAAESAGVQRIVGHLGNTVAAQSRGTAALAVVAVDDQQVAAVSLVSLAVSCAQQLGVRVVVADLCGGAPAARLLGVTGAGVHKVDVGGARLMVAIPDRGDVAPIGPLASAAVPAPAAACGEQLAAAFAQADVLLTLAALDPSVGGEHLATWAATAVAVVTAGRSSATRIRAAGEMVRLSGIPLVSAVLVGADKSDESVGVVLPPTAPA
jgi:capsular polysaccharide biosynthesis protein